MTTNSEASVARAHQHIPTDGHWVIITTVGVSTPTCDPALVYTYYFDEEAWKKAIRAYVNASNSRAFFAAKVNPAIITQEIKIDFNW